MDTTFKLESIPKLSQADYLHHLGPALWQRPQVLALWVEGSLARGNADRYSDVDLYVGVADDALEEWRTLDVAPLFGERYAAHLLSNFGTDFFVYHVYLTSGGIYDLHIQPQRRPLSQAQRLLLACRSPEYQTALLSAIPASEPEALLGPQSPDPTTIHQVLVSFWIAADKSRKVLYRQQEFTSYAGLNLFRHWLARLRFIEQTGTDCGDLTRPTIHGLKVAATALQPALATGLGLLMGGAATNRAEICQAQTLIQNEMVRVGRALAVRYQVDYPAALEQIVLQNWQNFMAEELTEQV